MEVLISRYNWNHGTWSKDSFNKIVHVEFGHIHSFIEGESLVVRLQVSKSCCVAVSAVYPIMESTLSFDKIYYTPRNKVWGMYWNQLARCPSASPSVNAIYSGQLLLQLWSDLVLVWYVGVHVPKVRCPRNKFSYSSFRRLNVTRKLFGVSSSSVRTERPWKPITWEPENICNFFTEFAHFSAILLKYVIINILQHLDYPSINWYFWLYTTQWNWWV